MLRLALPTEPQWLTLPHGVRILARPLTTAIYQAAQSSARRQVAALAKARDEIIAAGGTVSDLLPLDDTDVREGLFWAALSRALAQACVIEWRGVADAEGNHAPPTPENLAKLTEINRMAEALVDALLAPLTALATEGNG